MPFTDPLPLLAYLLAPGGHVANGPPPRAGRLSEAATARVRALIDAKFAGELTLADMAAAAGLSASHFLVTFRQTFGLSPHRYVLHKRLGAAARLVAAGVKLATVAQRAGFSDQAHLCRQFKARYGLPPGKWRRRLPGAGWPSQRGRVHGHQA
jgi:AraC-like DNA-binding protein